MHVIAAVAKDSSYIIDKHISGKQVAKSQIASLVADVFSNTAVAENKVTRSVLCIFQTLI